MVPLAFVFQNAAKKIETVMTPQLREKVETLRSAMRFIGFREVHDERLALFRRAILEGQRIELRYHARSSMNVDGTVRRFDPYGLANFGYRWYAIGFDHHRGEQRLLRLDRMSDVRATEECFTRPAGFRFERPSTDGTDRAVEVRLLFDPSVARFAQENAYFCEETHHREDGVEFVCRVREQTDVLSYILSWGSSVKVLAPESLRQTVAHEASKVLAAHTSEALLT